MTWYQKSQAHIQQVVSKNQHGNLSELEKTIRQSYPFGERKHYPYKAWLRAVNDYMATRRRMAGIGGVDGIEQLPIFMTEILPFTAENGDCSFAENGDLR